MCQAAPCATLCHVALYQAAPCATLCHIASCTRQHLVVLVQIAGGQLGGVQFDLLRAELGVDVGELGGPQAALCPLHLLLHRAQAATLLVLQQQQRLRELIFGIQSLES